MRDWLSALIPPDSPRDDLLTIATELATNAIMHTASGNAGQFGVELICSSASVLIVVTDQGGPGEPQFMQHPGAEHGRGLALVQALSAQIGIAGDSNGRMIWAEARSGV